MTVLSETWWPLCQKPDSGFWHNGHQVSDTTIIRFLTP
jgi:hypothetical protein